MLADWMIVDEGVAEVSSEWSVEAGILVQRASFYPTSYMQGEFAQPETFAVYIR
jgi:hypothetical protein